MRADLHEQVFGLLQLIGLAAVGRVAEVMQRRRQHLGGRVEEGDATGLQLLDVLRLEHQVPGVHRRVVAQRGLDLVDVVADADGAPHVGNRVLVARVARIQRLEQVLVEVFPVRQLGLVQLLEHTGLDLLGEERVGRHHHVVTGATGQQLGFQHLVAVEDVIDDLDAGFLGEILQGVFGDIVGPVIDVQHLFLGLRSPGNGAGQRHGK